jgi:aspartyl-tRNA(Asn)/glutamyl-tRNA(Gln) amidotransferase subunit B
MTVTPIPYDEALQEFEPVIGLETHVELGTVSKMFCGCDTAFGAEPNTHVCPVCLGLPGALPMVNEKAIESTVRIGLALHCDIAGWCRFARKNYFYPDMPKNFQTSQYDEPLCTDGYLDVDVDGEVVRIEIERVHLEEDTGKSLHVGGLHRPHPRRHALARRLQPGRHPAGRDRHQAVTGTGKRPAEVAKAYVTELRDVLRGSASATSGWSRARCAATSTSRSTAGRDWGTRSETKNVNSLRSVERAVRSEVERQAAVLRDGGRIVQETRHFHEDTGMSTSGRSKEEATDYRYFPEPDLVPVAPDPAWVEELRAALPEAPTARRKRLTAELGLSELDAQAMVNAGVLDAVLATGRGRRSRAEARNWWLGHLAQSANTRGVEAADLPSRPSRSRAWSPSVAEGRLSAGLARQVVDGVLGRRGRSGRRRRRPRPGRRLRHRRAGCRRRRRAGRQPRHRGEGARRQGAGRRGPGRRGHEGHPRTGRRRRRPRDAAGAPRRRGLRRLRAEQPRVPVRR